MLSKVRLIMPIKTYPYAAKLAKIFVNRSIILPSGESTVMDVKMSAGIRLGKFNLCEREERRANEILIWVHFCGLNYLKI